jgi:transcriptional regulator with XRE-family HTH domain
MNAGNPPDTLGKRIAQTRLHVGAGRGKLLTQSALARQLGVTPPTVSQWEADASEPELAMIVKIAAALGVSPGYLAFGEASDVSDPDVMLIGGLPIRRSTLRRLSDEEIAAARQAVAESVREAPRTEALAREMPDQPKPPKKKKRNHG